MNNDGYRSAMEAIRVSNYKVTNTFPPVQVMCVKRQGYSYRDDFDVLDCYDTQNGKRVLSVGTDYSDNYYPTFVYEFTPENMHINDGAAS